LPAKIHPWLVGAKSKFEYVDELNKNAYQIYYCDNDYTLRSYYVKAVSGSSGHSPTEVRRLEYAFYLETKLENKDGDTAAWAVVIIKNGKLYGIKPSSEPITYTHKVVSDTLIFTFTNPNETDLIIKVGSTYGLFDESL
jgi:hypothetical protein